MDANVIKGGIADGKTPADLAKKHNKSLESINKEIEIGTKVEMEHTDSKEKAIEIATDHIFEHPDYYTNPKHGLVANEKKLGEETLRARISTLLSEEFKLLLYKQEGDALTFTIKADKRPAGKIIIDTTRPDLDKFTIEILDIELLESYDDLITAKGAITGLWRTFTEAHKILTVPKDGTEWFWEKLGAQRLNDTYFIFHRGH